MKRTAASHVAEPRRSSRASVLSPARDRQPRTVLLKEHAFQAIKDGILSDQFPGGSFLSERQIAAWLKMSKTPVRAAFERLEMEGFVTTSPQQGVVVRELTFQEIADHFEMRVALESFVVRNLAGRLTPDQVKQLTANLEAQRECVERGDVHGSVRLDGEFHLLLCGFFHNQEINRVMWQTRDKIFRVVQRVHSQHPERLNTNYPEHRAIAEAIVQGDGDLATERLLEHLEHGKQFLMSPRSPRG
jgi:GntR family transcriptional regulator, rspAB operon transcriptional repressor